MRRSRRPPLKRRGGLGERGEAARAPLLLGDEQRAIEHIPRLRGVVAPLDESAPLGRVLNIDPAFGFDDPDLMCAGLDDEVGEIVRYRAEIRGGEASSAPEVSKVAAPQ